MSSHCDLAKTIFTIFQASCAGHSENENWPEFARARTHTHKQRCVFNGTKNAFQIIFRGFVSLFPHFTTRQRLENNTLHFCDYDPIEHQSHDTQSMTHSFKRFVAVKECGHVGLSFTSFKGVALNVICVSMHIANCYSFVSTDSPFLSTVVVQVVENVVVAYIIGLSLCQKLIDDY